MATKADLRDSRVPPLLRRQVQDLCSAIQGSLNQVPRLAIPALILLYSGIEAMAWVSMADDRPDLQGGDFRAWVKTYLLPGSGLPCNEDDLWAARCGLVHAQIMDSKHARRGQARHIWYYVGPGNHYLIPLHQASQSPPTTLRIDALVTAFVEGTRRFLEVIEADSELEGIVEKRAALYYDEVKVRGHLGENGSWVETIPPEFRMAKSHAQDRLSACWSRIRSWAAGTKSQPVDGRERGCPIGY